MRLDKVSALYIDGTTINSSAGAVVQAVASTSQVVEKIHPFDTTGEFIGIYIGASGSETLECVLGPGIDAPINIVIPVGSRISLRSMGDAPTAGYLALNLLG